MKIPILCIFIHAITLCWSQDETVFHCTPKPGCQIAQCETTDAELPITCKSNNTAKSQKFWNLYLLVTRNTKVIYDLRKKNQKQEKEIHKLEKKNTEHLRRVKHLEKKNSDEINKLKKDFVALEIKNNELTNELNKQKEANQKMERAMALFEQKLTAMEKSQQIQTTSRRITRPTTKTSWKPTSSPEYCNFTIGSICYFAEIHNKIDVDYNTAVEICKKRNAQVGLFRDEESYNATVNMLRRGIPRPWSYIKIWTGIGFNPITSEITPSDSFIEWRSQSPGTGSLYEDKTNVYLGVALDPTDVYQGMANSDPSWQWDGVICEIQT